MFAVLGANSLPGYSSGDDSVSHLGSVGGGGSGGHGGQGFSAGSGLRAIAQGSADQANSAVTSQHSAARQAAFTAKSSLAQAAIGVSFHINTQYLVYVILL